MGRFLVGQPMDTLSFFSNQIRKNLIKKRSFHFRNYLICSDPCPLIFLRIYLDRIFLFQFPISELFFWWRCSQFVSLTRGGDGLTSSYRIVTRIIHPHFDRPLPHSYYEIIRKTTTRFSQIVRPVISNGWLKFRGAG